MYLGREMKGCKDSQAVQEPKSWSGTIIPFPPAALSTPGPQLPPTLQKHNLPRARAGRSLLAPKAPSSLPAAVPHQRISGRGGTVLCTGCRDKQHGGLQTPPARGVLLLGEFAST